MDTHTPATDKRRNTSMDDYGSPTLKQWRPSKNTRMPMRTHTHCITHTSRSWLPLPVKCMLSVDIQQYQQWVTGKHTQTCYFWSTTYPNSRKEKRALLRRTWPLAFSVFRARMRHYHNNEDLKCFHSYLCVCCFLWQEWTVKRKGKENPCWTDSSWMDLAPGNYCVKIQKAKPPLRHALFNISMEVFMWWLSVYRCFSWHRSINRIRFGAWASEAMLNYLWRRPHKWMGRLLIKRFNVT